MTKGAIKGKHARKFAERAKKSDFTDMIKTDVLPNIKLNKTTTFVDLCSGSGNIIPFIQNKVKKIIAVDYSDEMIKILNEKYKKIKTIKADAAKLPLENNSADIIMIKFSVHHIKNIKPVLKEVYRILKPNGQFVIIDFVFESDLIHKLIEPLWILSKAIKKGKHELACKYRTDKQLTTLLTQNKFKITYKKKLKRKKQSYRSKHYPDYIYLMKK